MTVAIGAASRAAATGAPGPRQTAKLGDVPHLAAALDVIGRDVAAYEQTERYWRAVWGGDP